MPITTAGLIETHWHFLPLLLCLLFIFFLSLLLFLLPLLPLILPLLSSSYSYLFLLPCLFSSSSSFLVFPLLLLPSFSSSSFSSSVSQRMCSHHSVTVRPILPMIVCTRLWHLHRDDYQLGIQEVLVAIFHSWYCRQQTVPQLYQADNQQIHLSWKQSFSAALIQFPFLKMSGTVLDLHTTVETHVNQDSTTLYRHSIRVLQTAVLYKVGAFLSTTQSHTESTLSVSHENTVALRRASWVSSHLLLPLLTLKRIGVVKRRREILLPLPPLTSAPAPSLPETWHSCPQRQFSLPSSQQSEVPAIACDPIRDPYIWPCRCLGPRGRVDHHAVPTGHFNDVAFLSKLNLWEDFPNNPPS